MSGLAAIVVHYRNLDDTVECLESLLAQEIPEDTLLHLIVVDNGSEGECWKQLTEWRKKRKVLWTRDQHTSELATGVAAASTAFLEDAGWAVSLIRMERNEGYAAGANAGLRFALADERTEDLWVLNNDLVLARDALCELVAKSRTNRRAIYGATLLYHDQPTVMQAAGGAVYLAPIGRSRHVGKRQPIHCDIGSPKLDYIIGASLFIPREVIHEIGLMPSSFFLYYEETEYCRLARSRGIELTWVPGARMIHKEGKSTGASNGFRRLSDLSFHYIVRNSMLFTEMRYPFWLATVLLFNVFECLRHCLAGDLKKLGVLGRALQDYWKSRALVAHELSASGD